MKYVISCFFLALILFLCLPEQSAGQGSGGSWLSYCSSTLSIRLNLGVQYYCVRFTKPIDWPALSVDSVKGVWESAAGRTVKLCFWKSFMVDSVSIWPVDPPLQSDIKTLYVSSGTWNSNKWTASGLNWTTDKEHFFVGVEQIGSSSQLCADGLAQPERRSYRRYPAESWLRDYGMFSNYSIAVYVSRQAAVAVHQDDGVRRDRFVLFQNYPNPFNPSTKIRYTISHSDFVVLKVYDLLGRVVKTLVNEEMSPGTFETIFDGTGLPSGVYLYRLQAGMFVQTGKLVLQK